MDVPPRRGFLRTGETREEVTPLLKSPGLASRRSCRNLSWSAQGSRLETPLDEVRTVKRPVGAMLLALNDSNPSQPRCLRLRPLELEVFRVLPFPFVTRLARLTKRSAGWDEEAREVGEEGA